MHMYARIWLVALAGVAFSYTGARGQTLFSDDFNDGILSSSWYTSGTGVWDISEQNGLLTLSIPQGGDVKRECAAKLNSFILGDFDIQVEFSAFPGDEQSLWCNRQAGLFVSSLDDNGHGAVKLEEYSYSRGRQYAMVFREPSYSNGGIDTAVSKGRLRLTRTDDTFRGYYWEDSDWVFMGSCERNWTGINVGLIALQSEPDHPSVGISFDNFSLVADTLSPAISKLAVSSASAVAVAPVHVGMYDGLGSFGSPGSETKGNHLVASHVSGGFDGDVHGSFTWTPETKANVISQTSALGLRYSPEVKLLDFATVVEAEDRKRELHSRIDGVLHLDSVGPDDTPIRTALTLQERTDAFAYGNPLELLGDFEEPAQQIGTVAHLWHMYKSLEDEVGAIEYMEKFASCGTVVSHVAGILNDSLSTMLPRVSQFTSYAEATLEFPTLGKETTCQVGYTEAKGLSARAINAAVENADFVLPVNEDIPFSLTLMTHAGTNGMATASTELQRYALSFRSLASDVGVTIRNTTYFPTELPMEDEVSTVVGGALLSAGAGGGTEFDETAGAHEFNRLAMLSAASSDLWHSGNVRVAENVGGVEPTDGDHLVTMDVDGDSGLVIPLYLPEAAHQLSLDMLFGTKDLPLDQDECSLELVLYSGDEIMPIEVIDLADLSFTDTLDIDSSTWSATALDTWTWDIEGIPAGQAFLLLGTENSLGTVPTPFVTFCNLSVTAPVPEPATLGLLALGGMALLRRRRVA